MSEVFGEIGRRTGGPRSRTRDGRKLLNSNTRWDRQGNQGGSLESRPPAVAPALPLDRGEALILIALVSLGLWAGVWALAWALIWR
jgi:hypothetical protein